MAWFCFFFLLSMYDFKISTLNLNWARADSKRALLFKLTETKKIDGMLIQEAHSTDNVSDRKRTFNAEVILSQKSSLSGGVGVLFAKNFSFLQ